MSAVIIDYTNWRGEQRERHIVPQYIVFGSTEYHPGQQWLLVAHDLEKGVRRTFAMDCIHSWRNTEAPISLISLTGCAAVRLAGEPERKQRGKENDF